MNIYQGFAQLCEHTIVTEYSSAIALAKDRPSLPYVVKAALKKFKVPYDLEWLPVNPKSLTREIPYRQLFLILVIGAEGSAIVAAAPRTKTLYNFQVIIGNEVTGEIGAAPTSAQTVKKLLDQIKATIGFKSLYFAEYPSQTAAERKIELNRYLEKEKFNNQGLDSYSVQFFYKKFKPLLIKTITKAEADIKGFINTLIASGNYEEARAKLNYLERLQKQKEELLNQAESGQMFILRVLRNSLMLTAKYLYPNDVDDDLGLIPGSFFVNPKVGKAFEMIVKKIEAGDMKTLGIVLGFFKRTLLFNIGY
jgi:hypothetical protein